MIFIKYWKHHDDIKKGYYVERVGIDNRNRYKSFIIVPFDIKYKSYYETTKSIRRKWPYEKNYIKL